MSVLTFDGSSTPVVRTEDGETDILVLTSEGIRGPQGQQGPTGPVGSQGPQGDVGPEGPAGPQGDPGPVGPQGPGGPAGAIGPAGPEGPAGVAGPAGPKGDQGEPGQQGVAGPAGVKGDTGDAGPVGPAGPTGPQGLPGEPGVAGEPGPAGAQGPVGPVGPEGPQGPAGTTSWNGITDRPASFPPAPHDHDDRYVQTVNGLGPDAQGNVEVEGGGGPAAPGTMVWRGDYSPTASYVFGDLVRTTDGLFVALAPVTGITPSIIIDPFTDTFDRASSTTVGTMWTVNDGWGISANKASITGTDGKRLLKTLTPDGTVIYTGITRDYDSGMNTRFIFGWVDASNYYYYNGNNGVIYKVVNAAATSLGTVPGVTAVNISRVLISKIGNTITVEQNDAAAGLHTLTITDNSPLTGSMWGLSHYTYGGITTYATKLDKFEFTPQASASWSVIERKWNLDSLTDVQIPYINDNDVLTYDAATSQWLPEAPQTQAPGSPATGVMLSRTSTTALASASGTRAIAFDTTVRQDTGWTSNPGAGQITVPANGWYTVEVHARLSSATTGNMMCSVDAGLDTIIRGHQMSVSTVDASCGGPVWLAAGTVLTANFYSSASAALVGNAIGSYMYFRVTQSGGPKGDTGPQGPAGVSGGRVFIQATQPADLQANDIWIW